MNFNLKIVQIDNLNYYPRNNLPPMKLKLQIVCVKHKIYLRANIYIVYYY